MTNISKASLRSIQQLIALSLWDTKAIKINMRSPFKLVSGNYSPIYINCRQLISSPSFVDLFTASSRLLLGTALNEVDVIAGGESAGIPFAAFLARALNLPMVYVRKQSKTHGLSTLVEGESVNGRRVLLVEDLITDGGSKLHFIEALRAGKALVGHTLVIFDRLQGGARVLRRNGITLHSLTDINAALRAARESQLVTAKAVISINEYFRSPKQWHATRRLAYTNER